MLILFNMLFTPVIAKQNFERTVEWLCLYASIFVDLNELNPVTDLFTCTLNIVIWFDFENFLPVGNFTFNVDE